jgi:dienelactone hydrolase
MIIRACPRERYAALAPAAIVLLTLSAPLSLRAQQTIASPPSLSLTVPDSGFAGRYYEPTTSTGPAVIVLNGSNGGYPSSRIGRSLADNGNPALLLSYFSGQGSPPDAGLPTRLQDIPLEYFCRVIEWLHARTGQAVVLIGESRGAELALLLASRRADVAGVVAFAPSTAVWRAPGFSPNEPVRAAWTLGGRPLPYLRDAADSGLTSVERFSRTLGQGAGAAAIPVEQIRGRVLLVAGDDDRIWPSGPMADSIASRAREHGGPEVQVLRYPNAGHLLMGPGPGRERFVAGNFVVEFGGTEAGNRAARDDAWARTLSFLRPSTNGSSRGGRPHRVAPGCGEL